MTVTITYGWQLQMGSSKEVYNCIANKLLFTGKICKEPKKIKKKWQDRKIDKLSPFNS